MALRDKLRRALSWFGGMGAVDHPANGGITGEQSLEDEPEATDRPEK